MVMGFLHPPLDEVGSAQPQIQTKQQRPEEKWVCVGQFFVRQVRLCR